MPKLVKIGMTTWGELMLVCMSYIVQRCLFLFVLLTFAKKYSKDVRKSFH